MPRTEVYQLRLSKDEKDELARRAKLQGVSIAKLIRQRLDLDANNADMRKLKEELHPPVRTWGGKPAASDIPAWKKLLPPT